jgi:undecaprenyl diphosphate synthase
MQSAFHVAIIMDGNGRWASSRGRPRAVGHRAGAEAVRRTVEAAPGLGISTLTLYAFSGDNWGRPASEVGFLMRLFAKYLKGETAALVEQGVRLTVIGRRDRLGPDLARQIAAAEAATATGTRLHLRLGIDYSARDAIVEAARRAREDQEPALDRALFALLLGDAMHEREPARDVDLLIRTGGEQRLSDFLLWECAYAELTFSPKMWPEWTAADLAAAIENFHTRERRFGLLPAAAEGA